MTDNRILLRRPGTVPLVNAVKAEHWATYRGELTAIREWFGFETLNQRKQLTMTTPWEQVTVEFLLTCTRTLPDTDAVAMAAKAALDGIVDGELIADDGPEQVRSITYHAPERAGKDELTCLVKRIR